MDNQPVNLRQEWIGSSLLWQGVPNDLRAGLESHVVRYGITGTVGGASNIDVDRFRLIRKRGVVPTESYVLPDLVISLCCSHRWREHIDSSSG